MKWLTVAISMALVLGLVAVAMAGPDDSVDVIMNVNEIWELELNDSATNVTLTVIAPTNPGDDPQDDTDTTRRLFYTSTVNAIEQRNIQVSWAAGNTAPAGCSLWVQAAPAGGKEGASAGSVEVSNVDQDIVTGIESCATGRAGMDGASLTFTLQVDDPTLLVAGESQTSTVTFTITDS